MALPKIIDNKRKSFLDIFAKAADLHDELSVATGYWDIGAMELTMEQLRKFKKVRLLIGREPLIPRHHLNDPEPDYPDKDFKFDLSHVSPESKLRDTVTEIKRLMAEGQLEVRIYRKTFLHAKCYIFGNYDSDQAIGIIGSSNFTKNGITTNTELNALEDDHRIVTFKPQTEQQEVGHLFWFDELWSDPATEAWNEQFGTILEQSPVGDRLFSPYETYIKTLYELYKEELDEDQTVTESGTVRQMFDFQAKNVNALLRRLNKRGVAMLADSVGLGKTITAINVIKQYLDTKGGKRRVEIVCPKSLVKQWEKELTKEEVYGLKPLTLQNHAEIKGKMDLDDIASVALFVIDESHNLRQSTGVRFQLLLDWIRKNPKGHVLLLTATPINNELTDLTNQILLGAGGEADVYKVTVSDKQTHTTQITFHQAIENLRKKINQDLKREGTIDYDHIKRVMNPIIRAFVVRRTRQGIEREYGKLIIDGVEKAFPRVVPEVTEYELDAAITKKILKHDGDGIDLDTVFAIPPDQLVEGCRDLKHPLDQVGSIKARVAEKKLKDESPMYFVFQLILMLGFMPYRWMMYRTKYYGKTRDQIRGLNLTSDESKRLLLQLGIFGILRTVFLKRMESSVAALQASLDAYELKLTAFEKGIEAGKVIGFKNIKDMTAFVDAFDDQDDETDPDELKDAEIETIDPETFRVHEISADIARERKLIALIKRQLELLAQDDSKLHKFGRLLASIRKRDPKAKVLVFSYFADTINYLKDHVQNQANFINEANTGFVSSKTGGDSENLASRFSPISKDYKIKEGETELQYLFSTDVLSEGQNLQDAGILINYDLHWNPVRMIQRNGRVNRLGSTFDEVHIFNMRPEAKLDSYLRLIQRLENKIELIRNTVGTDTPVLAEDAKPLEFTDSVAAIYSKDMNERMKALEEAEKAADFLLSEDDYVLDLKEFQANPELSDSYKETIYNISDGKWALMPNSSARGDSRPEVLGLVRMLAKTDDGKGLVGHQFAMTDKQGGTLQAVYQLQALEWLRTTPDDNQRSEDRISLHKPKIKALMEERVMGYFVETETATPVAQENDILRLLFQNGYEEEIIESVRAAFSSTNVFLKRTIDTLKRSIMRKQRNGEVYQEDLKQLVSESKKTSEDSGGAEVVKPDFAEGVLYYIQSHE